jgi:hypothetical protein
MLTLMDKEADRTRGIVNKSAGGGSKFMLSCWRDLLVARSESTRFFYREKPDDESLVRSDASQMVIVLFVPVVCVRVVEDRSSTTWTAWWMPYALSVASEDTSFIIMTRSS